MLPTASSRGHSSIAERWSASGRGKSELVMLKRLQLAFYYKHLLMVRALQGLSEAQIEARFHAADINGDDKLNFREFDKMLNSFNVNLAPGEREQLFQRFDSDNSGGLDLEEFMKFVRAEQDSLLKHVTKKVSKESHERKWNNSVSYRVDLAGIASQMAKREKARAERDAKRNARSMSPPLTARARSKAKFFGENYAGGTGSGNNSNQSSQARLSRPSSADGRMMHKSSSSNLLAGLGNNGNGNGNGNGGSNNYRPKSPGAVFGRPKSPGPGVTVPRRRSTAYQRPASPQFDFM
jgi:hypothetical protein